MNMLNRKNKKGISPLIATVLIIGFTIVLAALVITWGTKLFKTTVSQTETASQFSLACTTGLKLEITEKKVNPTLFKVSITMRNQNQDKTIDDFNFIVYDAVGKIKKYAGYALTNGNFTSTSGKAALEFPVPQTYTINVAPGDVDLTKVSKVEVYPIFTIEGNTKACDTPELVTF